jgi:hypothetical protein
VRWRKLKIHWYEAYGIGAKEHKIKRIVGDTKRNEARFVLCVPNKDYPASLKLRKVYRLLNDELESKHDQVQVIDESGKVYLYPEEYFRSHLGSVLEAFRYYQGLMAACDEEIEEQLQNFDRHLPPDTPSVPPEAHAHRPQK